MESSKFLYDEDGNNHFLIKYIITEKGEYNG